MEWPTAWVAFLLLYEIADINRKTACLTFSFQTNIRAVKSFLHVVQILYNFCDIFNRYSMEISNFSKDKKNLRSHDISPSPLKKDTKSQIKI